MKITRKQLREMIEQTAAEQSNTKNKPDMWAVRGTDYDRDDTLAVFNDKSAADEFLVKFKELDERLGASGPEWGDMGGTLSVEPYDMPEIVTDIDAAIADWERYYAEDV
jgi:hypothetical protein